MLMSVAHTQRTPDSPEHLYQLLDGGRPGQALLGPIQPARQADRGVRIGERIPAIHEDRGGAPELCRLRLLRGGDQDELDCVIRAADGNERCAQSLVRDLPVRTAIEIQQRNGSGKELHRQTVTNLT